MINFERLQWAEEQPAARLHKTGRVWFKVNATRGGRYDNYVRLLVSDPEIAAALYGRPVRFLTAYSDAHGSRAMAFEPVEHSAYSFGRMAKGTTVYVSFGLFAWMHNQPNAHPVTHWAWDGTRLVVVVPASLQTDVTSVTVHVANALVQHTPAAEPTQDPASTAYAAELGGALVDTLSAKRRPRKPRAATKPRLPVSAGSDEDLSESNIDTTPETHVPFDAWVTPNPHVEQRRHKGHSGPQLHRKRAEAAEREAHLTRTNDSPHVGLFAPRPLSRAEQEAARVDIVRRRKHTPVVIPPRTTSRPETDATRLQSLCRVLQLDPEIIVADNIVTLKTVHGILLLTPEQTSVIRLLMRNVDRGYGATGISELHSARFTANNDTRHLTKLEDTEAWLTEFATKLTCKVGITFRIAGRLYALDSAHRESGETP